MRISLFIFLILNFHCYLFGQQSAYFLFGEKEFEGVDIYDVIQDNDNNYWFATDQGLIKHDGYTFENIECEAMKGNSVFGFVKSNDGTIYCHNLNHQVFEIKNNKCNQIFEIPDKGIDISLITTKNDKLLVCSSREVYLVDNVHFKSLNLKTESSYITLPTKLKNNRILFHYIGTNKLIEWNSENNTSREIILKNKSLDWSKLAFKFFQYRGSIYLISTTTGDIYLLNENTFEITYQTKLLSKNTNNHRIYSFNNRIFVGNNISGINIYNGNVNEMNSPFQSYSDYFISDVFKDREGNILLSTFDNGILVIPDSDVLDVDESFNNLSITKMYSSSDNIIYLGTNQGQSFSFKKKLKTITPIGNKKIETIFKWNEHPFLFTDNKGLSITNLTTGKTEQIILGSLKDMISVSDKCLFAALNTGVYYVQYDENKQKFSFGLPLISGRAYKLSIEENSKYVYASTSIGLFHISPEKKIVEIKYKGNSINTLAFYSKKDRTYISTRKHGVLVCSKGNIIDQFFPELNGTSLFIFKMVIHNDKIYANTQIGLVVLNKNGKALRFINRSAGLSTNKIIDFEIFNNELWITHSRGLQKFNLDKINHEISAPTLNISSVFVNSKAISLTSKKGQYSSTERKFKFVFRVNTLKNRENIRYHYKLEGNNEDWHISLYNDNNITYNALAPGNYRFIVKAENNGVYSPLQTYTFTIIAPFYQRWWFNLSIGLSLILLMTFIYKRQLRIQKKKADQLNELNASRLTAIQSQMNPHFIFNSLNSIQDLVLKGDIDNSYTFITKFSNLVRRTLNYSDKDFIDFEQEIKLIELYLSLEKLRFKEDLNYTIDTTDIEDIMIPPMLIQPFIENALVHGLLHKEGVKQLNIKFSLDAVLICEITDNGVGREKALEIKNRQRANHESFAVNAIKRRFNILKVHYKGELGFVIEDITIDGKVEGTKVILRIPIRNKF